MASSATRAETATGDSATLISYKNNIIGRYRRQNQMREPISATTCKNQQQNRHIHHRSSFKRTVRGAKSKPPRTQHQHLSSKAKNTHPVAAPSIPEASEGSPTHQNITMEGDYKYQYIPTVIRRKLGFCTAKQVRANPYERTVSRGTSKSQGARTPSTRRSHQKWPPENLFTNTTTSASTRTGNT